MAKFTVGAFLPSRLTLGKCRDELAARVADALTALTDMIRDGRRWPEEHDRNGPLLDRYPDPAAWPCHSLGYAIC